MDVPSFVSSVRLHRIGFVSLSAALLSTAAYAQAPTSVNPAQIEKRFEQPATTLPPSRVEVPAQPEPGMSEKMREQLAKKRFTLKSVAVTGNTVYNQQQLSSAWDGQAGKEISMLDAQGIARQITDRYRASGYLLSQAVVQGVDGGTLKIRVVEGYIANVTFQGDIKGDKGRRLLESYAANLKSKRPVQLADLERYLLLMDDLPGATAKGLVRPSATAGAADLVVTLSHKTYEASYTLDNRGTDTVGRNQHTATVAANSIFGMYDRTLFRFITTSPMNELHFFDLRHEQQLSDEGTRLLLNASYSTAHPGDFLTPLDIDSSSYFLQAELRHPFSRSRAENLTGRFIVDARSSETDALDSQINDDRLRVARVGGAWDFADTFSGVNLFDVEIAQGIDIFNATDEGTAQTSRQTRTNGETDFTKVTLDITRTQPLPAPGFSVYTALASQYSFSRLLAAEQFAIGGASYGRAYDPSEVTGDHGVAAKAELRYGQALNDPYVHSYQVYGFYDIGRTWLKNAGAGGNDKMSLSSAGAGLRVNFSEHLSGNAEVAVPLTKDPSNRSSEGKGHPRLFFSATGRF